MRIPFSPFSISKAITPVLQGPSEIILIYYQYAYLLSMLEKFVLHFIDI